MAHDPDALTVPAGLAIRIGDELYPIGAHEKFGLVLVALIQARTAVNGMYAGRLIVQVNSDSVQLRTETTHHAAFTPVKLASHP